MRELGALKDRPFRLAALLPVYDWAGWSAGRERIWEKGMGGRGKQKTWMGKIVRVERCVEGKRVMLG